MTTTRRRLPALALATLALTQLGGCWFVFIPGALIQAASDSITGASGEHCVGNAAYVGQTIKLTDGHTGTVKSVSGVSSRCQDPTYPVRASIALNP